MLVLLLTSVNFILMWLRNNDVSYFDFYNLMCKVCEFANLACDSLGPSQPIVFLFSSLFPTGVVATSTTIISHSFLLFQIVFVTVLASTSTSMSFTNLCQLLISKILCISLFLSSISKDLQMTKIFKSIWSVFKYLNDFRYYI